MAKRKGRKRKNVQRREPGGSVMRQPRRPVDRGTTEIQDRRRILAGKGNPDLTSYPLGVLLNAGTIDDQRHQAGCKFAWLYRVVIGRTSIAAVNWDGIMRGGDGPDDARLAEYEKKLEHVSHAVKAISRQHYDALLNVAVFERTPRWMLPGHFRTEGDVMDSRRFSEALVAVAAALGHRERAAC